MVNSDDRESIFVVKTSADFGIFISVLKRQFGIKSKAMVKVAIVGAGAAGLCALRHLSSPQVSQSTQFTAVCFEQASRVGGTWVYSDHIGKDEYGLPVHSSMYQDMRTNLPKEIMAFPDFAFPKDLPSFNKHQDVQRYLEDYASHFDVIKHIRFHTRVICIKPLLDNTSKFRAKWEVTTQNVVEEAREEINVFDAVLICNGHYAIPLMPDIPGLETFDGQVLHSHDYRRASDFVGKNVVILGASASGQDICLLLSPESNNVYLSHNKPPLMTTLPDNVHQKPGITKVTKNHVAFLDGSSEDVDVVMLCTGYHYDFSFLSPECGIEVNDGRITPLYKHLINTKFPNFAIIGACKLILPFPMFHMQSKFFKSVLDGTLTLPTEEEMNEEIEEHYRRHLESGLPHRLVHTMSDKQFSYNDELADMAKFHRLPDFYRQLYIRTFKLRQTNLMDYKTINFSVDINEKEY